MERFADRIAPSLPGLIARCAVEVHRRPAFAVGLYAAALAGVMASPFGRVPGRPAAPRGRGFPAAAAETPQAALLREIERAGLRAVERGYRPGEEVYTPGDPADSLYFLLSGVVRTYRIYGDFKQATTALLKDEGVFGTLDLAEEGGGSHQEDFAEAVTAARVLSVRKGALAWLVKRRPEASLALLSVFSERGRQSDELLESLLPREVADRLAALLLNLGERFGEEGGGGEGTVTIGLRLTHQQLASMIASTREAVSKVMTQFRREGLIEVRDRRIVLLDVPALSERAEGGPRAW
jgi:CRP/FNR family transcriptional regulator